MTSQSSLGTAAADGDGAWISRVGLGRKFALALLVASLVFGLMTYAVLTGAVPYGSSPQTILILLNLDLVLLLLFGAVVARRLVGVWQERRRGLLGARLHTRLVVLFSLVALAPAIVVSLFSAIFFTLGVQNWFSDRVRTALVESQVVADAYLAEHQQVLRGDILAMARDLSRNAQLITQDPAQFQHLVRTQGLLRSLTEAYVFDKGGRILAYWKLSYVLGFDDVPYWAVERARNGELVLLTNETDDRVRAIVKLEPLVDTYLYVARYVEPTVVGRIQRVKRAVAEYESMEGRRSSFEITFTMMFVLVALLLLLAAVWVGLSFATRLARPISALVRAAEQVRAGDLAARVDEGPEDDELAMLSRAFNRMTGQLQTQRSELVDANRQLDARRHFMETVLAGVSAGVVGLDAEGRINLPNRSASNLLETDLGAAIGKKLEEIVPEFGPLLKRARVGTERLVEEYVDVERSGRRRNLLARITAERTGKRVIGFVVTFDDVTELMSAQRKAAWADVARRIAHEIKNPLTPIQLSAERLNRRYLKQLESDKEAFKSCTETIIRQVGDIGRMVDEFSSFARMPAPDLKEEDLAEICRRAIALQRNARPAIEFVEELGEGPVPFVCDAQQIGQALTNLLQNAVDSIEARVGDAKTKGKARGFQGKVVVRLERHGDRVAIDIEDDGRGLPEIGAERLTEPYVTTRPKGTGLGLAIVKKIADDHGGSFRIEDRESGGACVRLIFAQTGAHHAETAVAESVFRDA